MAIDSIYFSLCALIPLTVQEEIARSVILPSQGFSMTTLWRGALGMAFLILLAFLFSSNKKAIHWKTIGIGISLQLFIALGVLGLCIMSGFLYNFSIFHTLIL